MYAYRRFNEHSGPGGVLTPSSFLFDLQAKNHAVIWDKIITSKDAATIRLTKESPEYAITDHTADLRYATFQALH